ncbi:MAG: hypothetical protein L3K26_11220 [Candidatus Hydrogenedentes bacterium]|nr:hypothetical protein [Candidatus Hydrogenedentota bacterium]
MSPIPRREWYFPALLALFFIVAGSLPYIYGYATAPDDADFMGFIGRGTPGANSYLAFARQAAEGQNAFTNLYTPESPIEAYVNVEWWLMGNAARLTGLSLIVVFHFGRILSVFAFVLAVYYLCAVSLRTYRSRRAALLLICCGTGLGWVLYGINGLFGTDLALSLDTRGVSIFGYLMNKPHFIRAGAFAALQYAWFIRADQTGQTRFFCLSGLAAAGHSLIRPYQVPEACLFLVLYWLLRSWQRPGHARRLGMQVLLAAACHAPLILWHVVVYLQNPLGLGSFTSWDSLFLISQIFWLGVPFAAVLAHVVVSLSQGRHLRLSMPVLGIWLITAFLLLHSHPYFRWGVESYFVWVFAPPVLFVQYVWPRVEAWRRILRWPHWFRYVTVAAIVIAAVPGNALIYGKFFNDLRHPDPPWQYYLYKETRTAIDWLAQHGSEGDVVLASHDTSQFIPRLANLRVVTGQDVLTDNYTERNGHILRFFQSPGDEGFKQWLCRETSTTYIFVGPFERELAIEKFAALPWMEPVYSSGKVSLFAVRLP